MILNAGYPNTFYIFSIVYIAKMPQIVLNSSNFYKNFTSIVNQSLIFFATKDTNSFKMDYVLKTFSFSQSCSMHIFSFTSTTNLWEEFPSIVYFSWIK